MQEKIECETKDCLGLSSSAWNFCNDERDIVQGDEKDIVQVDEKISTSIDSSL